MSSDSSSSSFSTQAVCIVHVPAHQIVHICYTSKIPHDVWMAQKKKYANAMDIYVYETERAQSAWHKICKRLINANQHKNNGLFEASSIDMAKRITSAITGSRAVRWRAVSASRTPRRM